MMNWLSDCFSAVFYQRLSQFVTWPIHEGIINRFQKSYSCDPKTHVLDVGCGTGCYSHLFSDTNYIGIDLSYERVRLAKNRNKGLYSCQSADFLGFRQDCFDSIFCANMVHHLDDHILVSMLEEMKRVLKPGGRLIIYDIYKKHSQPLITRFAHWIDRGQNIRQMDKLKKLFDHHLSTYEITFFRNRILDFYNLLFIKN